MSDDSDSWSLDPELYHADYLDGPKTELEFGSKKDNPKTWFSFVVGLKMGKKGTCLLPPNRSLWASLDCFQSLMASDKNGSMADYHGTGFFLSLPDAKYKQKDVKIVLTAGHNLIGEDGKKATTIEMTSKELGKTWQVHEEMVEVCEKYDATSNQDGSPNDWGVIFIPTEQIGQKDSRNLGFEFSLPFALQLPFEKPGAETKIDVGGFKQTTKPNPDYIHSRLHFFWSTKQHLVYEKGGTEPGMSGSPLWITCNKLLTVVGIQ